MGPATADPELLGGGAGIPRQGLLQATPGRRPAAVAGTAGERSRRGRLEAGTNAVGREGRDGGRATPATSETPGPFAQAAAHAPARDRRGGEREGTPR